MARHGLAARPGKTPLGADGGRGESARPDWVTRASARRTRRRAPRSSQNGPNRPNRVWGPAFPGWFSGAFLGFHCARGGGPSVNIPGDSSLTSGIAWLGAGARRLGTWLGIRGSEKATGRGGIARMGVRAAHGGAFSRGVPTVSVLYLSMLRDLNPNRPVIAEMSKTAALPPHSPHWGKPGTSRYLARAEGRGFRYSAKMAARHGRPPERAPSVG